MLRTTRRLAATAVVTGLTGLVLAPAAFGRDYEVTITDMTTGQPLTPPVVATHHRNHAIFDVGQPASVGVREIAENGNSAPLLAQLEANPFGDIFDFTESTSGPLVPPGVPGDAMFDQSVTLELQANRRTNRLSWVSMLICTNDGFTGSDGIKLPRAVGRSRTALTDGYDARTEINTEDYADIVPPCQELIGDSSGEPGTGTSNPALAEGGVISHHPGIQGGSDLKPDVHGWTDPVAKITVERTG
jgi:Spondin_N